MENLDRIKEAKLLVGYHSRPSVDLLYVHASIQPTILVSHLFFKIPLLNYLLALIGFIPSKTEKEEANDQSFIDTLLNLRNPLMLLPGGVNECHKHYDDQFKVLWKSKPGFARVIYENKDRFLSKQGIAIIPFYTKNSELAYYNNRYWFEFTKKYSNEWYASLKKGNIMILPAMLLCMLFAFGMVLFPMPTKIDTYYGKAIRLKTETTTDDAESLEQFSARIHQYLQRMIYVIHQYDDNETIMGALSLIEVNNSLLASNGNTQKKSEKQTTVSIKLSSPGSPPIESVLKAINQNPIPLVNITKANAFQNYWTVFLKGKNSLASKVFYIIFGIFMFIQNSFLLLITLSNFLGLFVCLVCYSILRTTIMTIKSLLCGNKKSKSGGEANAGKKNSSGKLSAAYLKTENDS